MIDFETIKVLSKKYQTRIDNVAREYIQHLFLSSLYKQKESENLCFKGGTALKIIYQSPRFSGDLDFSSKNFLKRERIENLFINTLSEIGKENVPIKLKEAKFTSGGYLGILFYDFYDLKGEIFFEVSLRERIKLEKEVTTIVSEYLPSYILVHLSAKEIVKEKILALLERGKPRDYYDLYFILRHPVLNKFLQEDLLKRAKENLLKTDINFKRELETLLPVSHHQILKDFKNNLLSEIEKF